jgi:hypothetical protein
MSQKWHLIDQSAATQLTQLTSSPGVVVALRWCRIGGRLGGTLANLSG